METFGDITKCLCCEKNLLVDEHGCLHDAGHIKIEFGYGSRYDQLGNANPEDGLTKIDKILACDFIKAYICDDCFEKKQDLIKGFVKIEKVNYERKI